MSNPWGHTAAQLEPGEAFVKICRGELTIPPDHLAIAKANAAIRHWGGPRNRWRLAPTTEAQRACLDGPL